MKNTVWVLMVFFFLVLLSPVFMFAMLAPAATQTILVYWSGFVLLMTLIGGGVAIYARMVTRDS